MATFLAVSSVDLPRYPSLRGARIVREDGCVRMEVRDGLAKEAGALLHQDPRIESFVRVGLDVTSILTGKHYLLGTRCVERRVGSLRRVTPPSARRTRLSQMT